MSFTCEIDAANLEAARHEKEADTHTKRARTSIKELFSSHFRLAARRRPNDELPLIDVRDDDARRGKRKKVERFKSGTATALNERSSSSSRRTSRARPN